MQVNACLIAQSVEQWIVISYISSQALLSWVRVLHKLNTLVTEFWYIAIHHSHDLHIFSH